MNKTRFLSISNSPNGGAVQIAGLYLLVGGLWILFSDQVAARIALNEQMLTTISVYKGWGYVLVTAVLLYWLVQRHTARLRASQMQLHQVIDAMPAFISYVGADRHYRFTNKTYKEWYDERPEGKHIEAVIGKAAYQRVSKYIDQVLTGESVSHETAIPYQDTELFLTVKYIPDIAADGQVKGFFVLAQDRTAQRQAEEEQRRWADAFEGCYHGIAIGDPHTNRIVVCNPAFAGMLKCSVEDIVGSAILSLYAPSDHEHVRRQIEKADQIGHARYEAHMTRSGKDGSVFPVQMDIVSVLGEDGELLHRVVTAQDITQRKEAEKVLQKSEERYRIVSELTSDYAYKDRVEADGSIIPEWITDSFTRITGYTLEETFAPGFWQNLVYPEDIHILSSHIQNVLSGQPDTIETRVITKSGQVRWLRDYSNPIWDAEQARVVGLHGAVQDITEHKQAEESLQKKQAQVAGILNSAMDAIISTDTDQNILIFNPAAEAMFRCSQSEAIGQPLERFIPERFREAHRQYVHNYGQTGVTNRAMKGSAVVYGRRSNGDEFPSEASISQVDIAGEKIYTVILRDVTERKQAEEYLRRFELLSEHSRDIILFMDREDGRILEANAAAVRAYGYSREELLSLTVRDLRASDTQPLTTEQMAQADAGGILFEAIHQRKDGTTFPVEVSSQGATIGGVRTLISIVRDITERKHAARALRESQVRLDFALEKSHTGGWDLDLIDHTAFRTLEHDRIFGYESLLPQWTYEMFLDHVIPEDRAEVDRLFQEATTTQTDWNFECRIRRKDGEIRWIWAVGGHLFDEAGHAYRLAGIVQDITERKKSKEALRLKDELLRLTSEMAKVGGWEFDAETERGTWTDEVARIHDLDPARETNVEMGLSYYEGESREKVAQAVKEAVEHAEPYDLELEMVTAKGNHKWVRTMALPIVNDGKVVKVQGIFQDITERKQIEKALQTAHDELELKVQERTAALSESNALLQAMMDHVPDQIYFKDMQGRFIRNSRSQANLLGLNDPEQALGKTDFDFFPHAAKAHAEEQEVMRSGSPLVDFEEWVVWPDAREMWVSTTKVPLRNAQGQTIGIFGISHDITERKQTEQAIQQLNVDLEKQAEQLKAANKELEAFSYSVSHDLRAPLRAIDGYTRILVEDYESILDAEGKRICGVIGREARRMGQLIDDLLAFSRLGRKEMHTSKIDMRALAVSVLNELLKEEERERIDFHIGKLPFVRGDSSLIRQVWANLLSNAIKFTSRKARAVIEVGSKSSKDELIYYVRDSGAGFDMEYANKLFGVFQRLHSESEFDGTGVGLAIVQRIVHRHEGRVWAEGEVGKGATFYFALPRKEHHHE